MWNYEYFISYTFRWIDFVVILGLAVYAFVRWGLPYLKAEIEKEEQQYPALEKIIQDSTQEYEMLSNQLILDTDTAEQLKKQILLWQSIIKTKEQDATATQAARHATLEAQEKEIIQTIHQNAVNQIIIENALNQALLELQQRFHNADTIKKFDTNIIKHMQKSAS